MRRCVQPPMQLRPYHAKSYEAGKMAGLDFQARSDWRGGGTSQLLLAVPPTALLIIFKSATLYQLCSRVKIQFSRQLKSTQVFPDQAPLRHKIKIMGRYSRILLLTLCQRTNRHSPWPRPQAISPKFQTPSWEREKCSSRGDAPTSNPASLEIPVLQTERRVQFQRSIRGL